MSKELEYIENLYNNMYEATKYLEENKDNIDTSETNQSVAEILEQQNEGLEIVYSIKQALLELKAIKEANPSKAMECLERIDNTLCLNNIKGKLEFGIDTEEHIDCDSVIGMTEDLESIKQSLLKAQEQENTGVVGGRTFGKEIIYLKQSIEQYNDKPIFYVSRTYGNKYIVPQKQLDDLTNENAEYKKVLKLVFDRKVDIYHLSKSKTVEDYNSIWDYSTYCLTQEEFDLLKRWMK